MCDNLDLILLSKFYLVELERRVSKGDIHLHTQRVNESEKLIDYFPAIWAQEMSEAEDIIPKSR